jgi:hypothetical protein
MRDVRTLTFRDAETGDEAYVAVRAGAGRIGLVVSLREDGDVEVFFTEDEATTLADALRDAAEASERRMTTP